VNVHPSLCSLRWPVARGLAVLALLGLGGCIKPLDAPAGGAPVAVTAPPPIPQDARRPPEVLPKAWSTSTFFDEDLPTGGFTFTYGGTTTIATVEGRGADNSEFFLHTSLDPKEYSGVAACLWNSSFDLTPFLKTGALVFQARATTGSEKFFVGLADDEKSDGWKSVVRLPANAYGSLAKGAWTTFVVPLRDFPRKGMAWDAAKGIEKPLTFQWNLVQEFRVLSNKGENTSLEIDFDNVRIWADAVGPDTSKRDEGPDWADLDSVIDAPSAKDLTLPDEVLGSFFQDDFPAGGFSYGYGGRSTAKVLDSRTPGNRAVWATYLENDYSGQTIALATGKTLDLSGIRKTGSVSFWIRGGEHSQKFIVGLLDDQGGEKKVQTRLAGHDWTVLKAGAWSLCRIPLKAFLDDGSWWNSTERREVSSKMDWTRIREFRLSIARDENKPPKGQPVVFYLDQIQVARTSKGIYDPEVFWNGFQSDTPDQILTDFTKGASAWRAVHGASAQLAVSNVPVAGTSAVTGKALRVDFRPGDWYETILQLPDAPSVATDWSRHYAMSFWLYSEKPYQSVDVTLQDKGHEYFTARVGAARGWHRVVLPFRDFSKFPYYQPPEAVGNNRLDLDAVFQIGFKPVGDIPGSLQIAGLALTNLRETPRLVAPPVVAATFVADPSKGQRNIPRVFGTNVENWMPDMVTPQAMERLKPLDLGVVRYPGGLRADEDDWKQILSAKDGKIDTDEFLDWCASMGVEPLFTANLGSGTPQLAAEWVRHTNVVRKSGPKVKLWEIGNELYGNWHHHYDKWGKDGGTAYGKRAREFILAMKAVDPSIQVTVVWMLAGDWNRKVFAEVADVVDGVNVHHYAQTSGAESDEGLLAASSEVDEVMAKVRAQLDQLGTKGRKYGIWLTEWNSVDFNPGPQILSHVQALYVADYMGHLAQSPIEIANLWNIHNGREARRGDYGLLATTGDPDGTNARRPAYWGLRMASRSLKGKLLDGKSDQEALSGWASRGPDGKLGLLFVNKNFQSDYKTTLQVPGLSGQAEVMILDATNSGEGPGPSVQTRTLKTGDVLTIPKASVVSIRMK
jgi:hypothetical protein